MKTDQTNSDSSTRKGIRFKNELLEKINKMRGTTPLGTWVQDVCALAILETEKTKPKPIYLWKTPQGEFDNRLEACEASGLNTDMLSKLCGNDTDGFSRRRISTKEWKKRLISRI
jgi:hypothetical protein